MEARSYAGVSEEEFATFVHTYRDLCSNPLRIYLFLFADTCAKAVLYSSWLESQLRRPFAPLVLIAAGLPLLIYFVLTFCRLPPPVVPASAGVIKECNLARRSLHGLRRSLARGLDPKNLHHLGQVFRSRPSARQRGVMKLVT